MEWIKFDAGDLNTYPKHGYHYLVIDFAGGMSVRRADTVIDDKIWYIGDRVRWGNDATGLWETQREITHWQPLPEPPSLELEKKAGE